LPTVDPDLLVAAMAAPGTVLSVALLAASRRALPGCGPHSSCQAVLSSRWSRIGPIPVAAPAAALYAANLAAVLTLLLVPTSPMASLGGYCVQISAGLLPGVALWFILLQLSLGRFCRYCMMLHGVGLLFAAAFAWGISRRSSSVLIRFAHYALYSWRLHTSTAMLRGR